jgi:hypothetical protein
MSVRRVFLGDRITQRGLGRFHSCHSMVGGLDAKEVARREMGHPANLLLATQPVVDASN